MATISVFWREEHVLAAPGDFVLADGTVIGRHKGLHRYTVGQRRGMGIAWSEPLYVIRLEPDTNRVVVGLEGELYREGFTINCCNWLQLPAPADTELRCKIRYSPQSGTVYGNTSCRRPGSSTLCCSGKRGNTGPGSGFL